MQEIWSVRMRLQNIGNTRDLALFNLAIDSRLRGCDLLGLRVSDVASGGEVLSRAMIRQNKTNRPVRFEIMPRTQKSILEWIDVAKISSSDYLFPSRIHTSKHLSTRQYARIVESWVTSIGLDPAAYGTHSMRLPCPFGNWYSTSNCIFLANLVRKILTYFFRKQLHTGDSG